MDCGPGREPVGRNRLLQIEDCLDLQGGIALPPGVTLISLIDRNIANFGDSVAYRYLDYSRSPNGEAIELTWSQLGIRERAVGARLWDHIDNSIRRRKTFLRESSARRGCRVD